MKLFDNGGHHEADLLGCIRAARNRCLHGEAVTDLRGGWRKASIAALTLQGYVPTPAGWLHKSCVHEIPDGARVMARSRVVARRDGTSYQVPRCRYPAYSTLPNVSRTRGHQPPPDAEGWIEYAFDYVPSPDRYSLLMARWTVPATPVGGYSDTSVYYAFPGLERDGPYINQPVLLYAGSSWGWKIGSWHCDLYGIDCYHSTLRSVAAGDSLFGKVASAECADGECQWMIQTVDLTTEQETVLWLTDSADYWWVTGGTVEVHHLDACNQFPAGGVFFSSITLFDTVGQVTPSWTDTIAPTSPSCGYAVSTTPSSDSLYHSVQPPPALDNWIYVQAPTYTAEPSGGYPPYSYLWEVCALDCEGGGERAPIADGVHPNTVVHGWQYLSSQYQVYWTSSGWNLRSTVTDTQSQQARAEYHVP